MNPVHFPVLKSWPIERLRSLAKKYTVEFVVLEPRQETYFHLSVTGDQACIRAFVSKLNELIARPEEEINTPVRVQLQKDLEGSLGKPIGLTDEDFGRRTVRELSASYQTYHRVYSP